MTHWVCFAIKGVKGFLTITMCMIMNIVETEPRCSCTVKIHWPVFLGSCKTSFLMEDFWQEALQYLSK